MSLDAVSGGLWAEGGLHFPPSFPPTPASSPSKQTLPPASSHNMPFLSFVFFQIGNKSCLWLSCSLSLLDFSNQIYIVYCTTCIVQCTLYIIHGLKIQLISSSTIQKRRPGSMLHITFSSVCDLGSSLRTDEELNRLLGIEWEKLDNSDFVVSEPPFPHSQFDVVVQRENWAIWDGSKI